MITLFNKEKHEYLIDGVRATGVTSVIGVLAKPQLIQWAARMAVDYINGHAPYIPFIEKGNLIDVSTGNKYEGAYYLCSQEILAEAQKAHTRKKEAAGEHGTSTHELVENFIKRCVEINNGSPEDMGLEVDKPIEQFVEWAKKDVNKFLFSERQMFNEKMFIAGTADFAAVMKDGKKLIGDFKTSSGVYGIDYFLQCAGYKILAEGEGDEPYDGCVIVRLGKDNSFDVYYSYDSKVEEEAFRACLTLYRASATFKNVKKID